MFQNHTEESQERFKVVSMDIFCKQSIKELNLKANHNLPMKIFLSLEQRFTNVVK